MTNRQKLRQEAKKAADIVKTWPAWKRTILMDSLKATNSYSRVPIRPTTKTRDES
jgi:hypothetical protein